MRGATDGNQPTIRMKVHSFLSAHRVASVPLVFFIFFALSFVVDELFNAIAIGSPDSLIEHVADGLFMTGLIFVFLSADTSHETGVGPTASEGTDP